MTDEQAEKLLKALEDILAELKTLPHYYPSYSGGYTYPTLPCPYCHQYHY
jgi:hypothetical protein